MRAISIRNLDHVVVRVSDVDRSLAFYCEILGCSEERRVERIGLVQLRAGSCMIDLIDAKDNSPPVGAENMDHFAVRLESFNEAEIRSFLTEHGIASGEATSRYGAEGDGPSIYIEDPDGNKVELKGPPYAR